MTPQEHEKETKRIQRIIKESEKLLMLPVTLEQKIQIKSAIKALAESLRQHRLNYFELTKDRRPS